MTTPTPGSNPLRRYKLHEGGLLPIGLAVLTLAPLIAARLRGIPLGSRR